MTFNLTQSPYSVFSSLFAAQDNNVIDKIRNYGIYAAPGSCYDANHNEVDGSIYSPIKNTICISTQRLGEKLTIENVRTQTIALVGHEYAHLQGLNEEQASYIQKMLIERALTRFDEKDVRNKIGWVGYYLKNTADELDRAIAACLLTQKSQIYGMDSAKIKIEYENVFKESNVVTDSYFEQIFLNSHNIPALPVQPLFSIKKITSFSDAISEATDLLNFVFKTLSEVQVLKNLLED